MTTPDLFGTDEAFSVADLASEARRELDMRRQVYPRMVAAGRLASATAERRIALQASIVRVLSAMVPP